MFHVDYTEINLKEELKECAKEDISRNVLSKNFLPNDIEGIFIELDLKKQT